MKEKTRHSTERMRGLESLMEDSEGRDDNRHCGARAEAKSCLDYAEPRGGKADLVSDYSALVSLDCGMTQALRTRNGCFIIRYLSPLLSFISPFSSFIFQLSSFLFQLSSFIKNPKLKKRNNFEF